MNPDDAVQAHLILNADQSMGMHYGTFAEHPEQTIDAHEIDLAIALENHNVETSNFWVLQFGEDQDLKLDENEVLINALKNISNYFTEKY